MMFRISAEITAGFKKRWICSAGNSNLFEKLMKRTSNLKQRWYCKLGDMKNPFFHHGPWCFFSLPNVELFRGRFVYRIHHDFYLPSLSLYLWTLWLVMNSIACTSQKGCLANILCSIHFNLASGDEPTAFSKVLRRASYHRWVGACEVAQGTKVPSQCEGQLFKGSIWLPSSKLT